MSVIDQRLADRLERDMRFALDGLDMAEYVAYALRYALGLDLYTIASEDYEKALDATPLDDVCNDEKDTAYNRWRYALRQVAERLKVRVDRMEDDRFVVDVAFE